MQGRLLECIDDNDFTEQPKLFQIGNGYVAVHEELDDPSSYALYANCLWAGAVYLSALLREHSWMVRGRTVLEIGAGLGLPSVVAAALSATVTSTEQQPICYLADVAASNERLIRKNNGSLVVRELDWEWPPDRILREVGRHDVVIGCDILAGVKSGSKHFRQIVNVIRTTLRDDGFALLTWVDRAGAPVEWLLKAVETELPSSWEAYFLEQDLQHPAFRSSSEGDVAVMRISPKRFNCELHSLD
eukprot:TRINITY_DN23213_c0_g1_i1.p1 TRINITY_DN23213_c0_g1~~TRINITY_DN23213_c0_g1_i1.p1  ORF type:complete len:245 (+),score=42.75 TRINITY_DN23213_c0_g1_i1:218-952(+)